MQIRKKIIQIRRLFGFQWFDKWWWKYLLEKPDWYSKGYASGWTRFWCRANGHRSGVWWNNPGSEPNMRCKNCGDDLG